MWICMICVYKTDGLTSQKITALPGSAKHVLESLNVTIRKHERCWVGLQREQWWVSFCRPQEHQFYMNWQILIFKTDLSLNKTLSFLQNTEISSGAHSTSYLMGNVCSLPWGQTCRGVKFTTHVHVLQSLRMSGAMLPFPLYTFCGPHRNSFIFTFISAIKSQFLSLQAY
jgi:hypothetical protein